MKFQDYRIASEIKQNLEELGFKKPTDIQYKAIPPIIKGEDVLAIAQTGTGKTAAFAIPIIDKLHYQKSRYRSQGIKCLIMVPTRELAIQIESTFHKIGKNTNLKFFSLYGGVEQDPQIKRLDNGIDVLITTPGRMFDLVSQGHIDLSTVEILVLDEADHMLALGFIRDIQDVLKFLPKNRQTLFFSATIDEHIKDLAYSLVRKAIRIQISPDNKVAKNITHSVAYIEMDDKRFFLERILKENPDKKILVFVRTKVRAERVSAAMDRVDLKTITIHGDKDQKERSATMRLFREGKYFKVLIATDISARGIDIEKVDMVVNYDLPDEPENYVHRVGRTGRGEEKGLAVSFCSEVEKPVLKEIEEYLGKPIQKLEIESKDYEATIDLTEDPTIQYNPMDLIHEHEELMAKRKKKKKK